MPAQVGLWCVASLAVLSVVAIAAARIRAGAALVYGGCLIASLAGLAAGLSVLVEGGAAQSIVLPVGLPGLGAHFRVDALSAFFLVVINLGAAAACLYAIGYGRHEPSPLRVLPFFPVYLAGMNLVILADDAFSFLFAWEFMSLSSWALVMANHRGPANARAGYVYLLIASAGTLVLLLAFGLLAGADGLYNFAAMRAHRPDAWTGALVLLLVLLGAGSKAGLVPVHVWLPLAHPAAPSHVSALMSGVMTKVAIYGFLRIAFEIVGPTAAWTSMIVLAIGGITAAWGILYAVVQQDLKRLLAYSTVENIGIVFVGIGLAMAFQAGGLRWAAALAMTAALFHVLNHSMFKSLLFFGAGAVVSSTGQRNMEGLGGLIHRMPRTAVLFFVGCAAISALPPLNGFVSEWLTFQAILVSPQIGDMGPRFLIPAIGALLALSAALAAACFVKAYGITFLGRARTPAAEQAEEADGWSIAAMAILAGLCVLSGAMPGAVVEFLQPVVHGLTGARMPAQSYLPWVSMVPISESRSSYNGFIILCLLVAGTLLTAMLIHRVASRATRRSAIWDCGYPNPTPEAQYSSSSFAMPIRRVFAGAAFLVREVVDMPRPGDARPARYRLRVFDPVWRYGYGPLGNRLLTAAAWVNRLQFLTIRSYLTLVFAALIALLLVVAVWR